MRPPRWRRVGRRYGTLSLVAHRGVEGLGGTLAVTRGLDDVGTSSAVGQGAGSPPIWVQLRRCRGRESDNMEGR